MIVSGESNSRLSELRKYVITNDFSKQYISGGTIINDGVDYNNSTSGVTIAYYLGGIKYIDSLSGKTGTTFSFTAQGTSSPDFIEAPIYKDNKRENIIGIPKIANDVFIVRQETSVFEKNYALEYVRNLIELTTYAGGNYFKIVNNS